MQVDAQPINNPGIETRRTFKTRKKALRDGVMAGAIFPYALRIVYAFKGNSNYASIEFVPHFLAIFIGRAAIPQTVLLIYDTGLSILGDRLAVQYQGSSQSRTYGGFLRQWSWSIIEKGERILNSIDSVSSLILGIRTSKVIHNEKIKYSDLKFFEIFRFAVLKEIQHTVTTVLPMLFTVSLIRAAGYTVFGCAIFGIENPRIIMIHIALRYMSNVALLQGVDPHLAEF